MSYSTPSPRLNRTFYGIETTSSRTPDASLAVLIVPFMELKLVAVIPAAYSVKS